MPSYLELSTDQLDSQLSQLSNQYEQYRSDHLHLDMTRGKPCPEQLDLSQELLTILDSQSYKAEDGTDCRNYGVLPGLPEARRLFAELLDTAPENIFVLGNSSLNLMYDTLTRAMLFKLPDADKPWCQHEKVKFICPVPGYDRHFNATLDLGFELVTVPMTREGPDMDVVEALAASDPQIKGMWLVPLYSNPQGITCSDQTLRRLAAMKTAAPDFIIMYDNAYVVHHLDVDDPDRVPDIISLCEQAGNPNRVFEFSSFSKVTWAGAGVACIASSKENLAYVQKHLSMSTIGPDKINQLRHVRFLKNKAGVLELMAKHAKILKPKFDLIDRIMNRELHDKEICFWTEPRGGYFVSIDLLPGTAEQVVKLAADCGVALTPAGSTYPGGNDPDNANIRLAPSFPPLSELETAMEILCVCIQIAAIRKLRSQA